MPAPQSDYAGRCHIGRASLRGSSGPCVASLAGTIAVATRRTIAPALSPAIGQPRFWQRPPATSPGIGPRPSPVWIVNPAPAVHAPCDSVVMSSSLPVVVRRPALRQAAPRIRPSPRPVGPPHFGTEGRCACGFLARLRGLVRTRPDACTHHSLNRAILDFTRLQLRAWRGGDSCAPEVRRQ